MKEKLIAQIIYYENGEILSFTNENDFFEELKDTIYQYGLNGWSYRLYDKELTKKVNELLEDEF